MAVYDRAYQKVTTDQLEKCVRWCQNKLNLRDWEINLCFSQREEGEFGFTSIDNAWQLRADVWVAVDYCREKNVNCYAVIAHEMIHVLIGKCNIDALGDTDENIAYAFEDLLYTEYAKFAKIKIMPFQGGY